MTQPVAFTGTINTADQWPLPTVGTYGGAYCIQFESAGFAGTGIVLKARSRNSPTSFSWQPIPYTRLNVTGAASDATIASAPIATSGIIHVITADGMELMLDSSAGGWSGGAMAYAATPAPAR